VTGAEGEKEKSVEKMEAFRTAWACRSKRESGEGLLDLGGEGKKEGILYHKKGGKKKGIPTKAGTRGLD